MTDKPVAWWRPPPEFEAEVEQNRVAFREQFGSFDAAAFERYWLGTSEDGKYLAFQFHRPDGSIHRFALRGAMVEKFFTEIAGAIDEMGRRQLALAETKGVA